MTQQFHPLPGIHQNNGKQVHIWILITDTGIWQNNIKLIFYFGIKMLHLVLDILNRFCPWTYSLPGSSVHGILQAKIVECVATSFSRGPSWPRDWTQVFCIAGRFLIIWATRESQHHLLKVIKLAWTFYISMLENFLINHSKNLNYFSFQCTENKYYQAILTWIYKRGCSQKYRCKSHNSLANS